MGAAASHFSQVPKLELPSFGRRKDVYSLLKKSFLKRFFLDADLKALGQLFVADQHRILSAFSFSNKYLGIVLSGSLKFIVKSTGTVLKVFNEGDMLPLFLMGATSTANIKESVQFIGEKGKNKKPMSLATLSVSAWEAFMVKKPNLAHMSKFITTAELAKCPSFENVNISSLFIFGLMVDLACYRSHETILKNGQLEGQWRDCCGLVLRGKVCSVENNTDFDFRENARKTTAFAAVGTPNRRSSNAIGTASENSSTVQANCAVNYVDGSFFCLEKCMMEDTIESPHDIMCMADNTIVGYVSRVSVEIIQKEFPSLFEAMSAEFRLQVLSSIFPHVNVFRDLDERSQLKLCKSASIVAPTTDECLSTSGDACELGDKNDYVYMVLKGAVKVSCPGKFIIEKNYYALPRGGYAIVNDLPVIAELTTVAHTITSMSEKNAVLLRIPGNEFRDACGTFNSSVSAEAHEALRLHRNSCSLHDVLFSRQAFKEFYAFVKAELALENIIYWKALSIYDDILLHLEYIYAEEYCRLTEDKHMKRRVNTLNAIGTGNSRLGRHSKTQRAQFAEASRRQVLLEEADSSYSCGKVEPFTSISNDSMRIGEPDRVLSHFLVSSETPVPSVVNSLYSPGAIFESNRTAPATSVRDKIPLANNESSAREVSVNMDIHFVLVLNLMNKLVNDFLNVDSVNEVNISGKLRADMLKILSAFIPTSPIYREVMSCKYEHNCSSFSPEELLSFKKLYPGFDVWSLHTELFSMSLMEVLKMLDKGPFLRWKASKNFQRFLEADHMKA